MHTLLVALVAAVASWAIAIGLLFAFGRKSAARELATLIPNLVLLFRGLLRDRRVPPSSKALLWGAVLWIVSPIDLIPEFVPVIGPLDDAVVAALVLRFVLKRTDREVLFEHWRGDPATLERLIRSRGGAIPQDAEGGPAMAEQIDTSEGWCCDGRTYKEHASENGHCCQVRGTQTDQLPEDGQQKARERLGRSA
jgi:uncharacterized membrane protein YkvA (DUF1232 family)